jgi:DNA-binding NtrC family response regulator
MNKIAFIDDDYNVLEALKLVFYDEPLCTLYLFQDPVEALKKINTNNFSVVAADQSMPGMKGTDLLLLAKKKNPLTECLIMTGFPCSRSLKDNDFAIIIKPWDVAELRYTIHRALDNFNRNSLKISF